MSGAAGVARSQKTRKRTLRHSAVPQIADRAAPDVATPSSLPRLAGPNDAKRSGAAPEGAAPLSVLFLDRRDYGAAHEILPSVSGVARLPTATVQLFWAPTIEAFVTVIV